MSLYQDLIDRGCETDSHESDLYVKVNSTSTEIINWLEHKPLFRSIFVSKIDRELWYDIPFQYEPFWVNRSASETR